MSRSAATMKYTIHNLTIECVEGDITDQTGFDAVVNAANDALRPGGGVAGAIHQAAGPELDQACRPLAPIQPGHAVITPAFGLPNRYVVHCLGPVYGVDEPADQLLAACYDNALALAEQHQVQSIAFPALSTGAFGYPMEPAAQIAMRTVAEVAPTLQHVRHVRFVLWGSDALRAHTEALTAITDDA